MRKIIFLFIFGLFFLASAKADTGCFPPNSPSCGGSGGDDFNIFIAGCFDDGSLCSYSPPMTSCARKTTGYCECDAFNVGNIVPDCRGENSDGECARTCDTSSGYYCDMSDGDCISEGVGDCNEGANNWNDCVDDLGCYFDDSVCSACPPPGDKLCSDYLTEDACKFDICGFGTGGPDSYICRLNEIDDCGCYWDGDTCEFGFKKYDAEAGVDVLCNLEQTFDINNNGIIDENEECSSSNKRILQTTEFCEGSAPKPLETKEIDCGKAVSPLPFFSFFSFFSSLIVIFSYYSFRNRQDL